MKITVVGTGYVGLVTGTCFAEFGNEVCCVDIDASRIQVLNSGALPIYEPGLEALVETNVREGRLTFSTDSASAIENAQVVFIAVGTPTRSLDDRPDLRFVDAAARDIAGSLRDGTIIVTKSTVPVGTSRRLGDQIRALRGDLQFDMVSNPEFLREGSAVGDFLEPDRVVVGVESPTARAVMEELYRPLLERQRPVLFTSLEGAELTKYVANAYLATRITFVNEVANLCETLGVDVREIAKGIGLDHRIGPKFLDPGPGFGGSCFPKDTRALATMARRGGVRLELVETVISLNERRKRIMSSRVVEACGGTVVGKTIAVLGVTFKAGTDDMRDAPSLEIVPALIRAGASVRAHDPHGMATAKALLDGVAWCEEAYEAASGADAVLILTEWEAFRGLDRGRLREVMREPRVVDLRNLYEPEEMRAAGFLYSSVGRPPVDGRPAASRDTGRPDAAGLTRLAAT